MKIEQWDIKDIKPYEFNNRIHKEQQILRIAQSIEEFGFNQPIVVDEKGEVIVGHGRLAAAMHLELEKAPVLVKKGLPEKEKRAYRILDNKLQNDSTWDFDNVHLEVDWLEDEGFDIDWWGLDELRIDDDPEVEEVEAGETPEDEDCFIKRGDLIELGEHRVLCGDAQDLKTSFYQFDCIITDPPYGISVVKGGKVGADFGVAKKGEYIEIEGDDRPAEVRFLFELTDKVMIWGGNYFAPQLDVSGSWLVWDKRGDSGIKNTFADCEIAYSNFGGPARIYRQLWNGMIREGERDKRHHPTQKPVALMVECIRMAGDVEVIADPFLGSGTTLIAADQLGRICYGIEIEPKYCHVIIERYKKHCEQSGKDCIVKVNGETLYG